MKKVLGIVAACWCLALTVRAADLNELINKMKSKDVEVRREGARGLSQEGREVKNALPVLLKGLKDSDVQVRRFCAEAMGNTGEVAREALPALRGALLDRKEEKEVHEAVVIALGKMGKLGVELLIVALKDKSKEVAVRRKSVEKLGALGTDARPALPALLDALQDRDGNKTTGPGDMRLELVTALGNIASVKDAEVVKTLEAIAGSKSKTKALKNAASTALKNIKERSA